MRVPARLVARVIVNDRLAVLGPITLLDNDDRTCVRLQLEIGGSQGEVDLDLVPVALESDALMAVTLFAVVRSQRPPMR
jgi:hypothetical protein